MTTTITESRHARIASGNYTELDLQQAIGSTNMAAIEAIITESTASTRQIDDAWELRALVRELREQESSWLFGSHRRPSPKAKAMTHRPGGRKREVRKDHGTTSFYKEIEATNAKIAEGEQSPRTVRRRRNKNMATSGNPRRYKAALKRQARTTGR